jgi:hypothetical protein
VVGGAIGAVTGGLAGHSVAEQIDPTVEDAYWRKTYNTRPYVTKDATYDDYRPAYQYGWEARSRYDGRDWNDVERDMESGWDRAKGKTRLKWEEAKHAARDAWDRITPDKRYPSRLEEMNGPVGPEATGPYLFHARIGPRDRIRLPRRTRIQATRYSLCTRPLG